MVYEPGRAYRLAPDPGQSNYIVSEMIEFELRMLAEAMRAAATLCEAFDRESSDAEPRQIAALFYVFGERTADLVAQFSFPRSDREAA